MGTDESSVADRVLKAIGNVLERDDISLASTFLDLGADSLDAMEMIFEVEEEFDLSIPNEAARHMRTVSDVVEGIEKLLAGEEIVLPEEDAAGFRVDPSGAQDDGGEKS